MENKNTFPFKTNIFIVKEKEYLTPEPGDVMNITNGREPAIADMVNDYAIFGWKNDEALVDTYSTEQMDKASVLCHPLVFGAKEYGFIGYRTKSGTNRVFYLYEMP